MHRTSTGSAYFARIICLGLAGYGFLKADSTTELAWKTLKAGTEEKSAGKRAEAVTALGLVTGNAKAIELAEDALHDPSSDVRDAAVNALGEMGAKTSLPKIKALLNTADVHEVVRIAAVLKKLNDPGGYEIYYEILTGRRKGNGGILAGIKDKKALEKMGLEEALGFVPYAGIGIGAYNYFKANTSLSVDAAAATELALDPDPKAEKALVHATYEAKDLVKLAALRALAKRGDPAVVSDITHQIYAERSVISYTAAAAIVHLTDRTSKHAPRVGR